MSATTPTLTRALQIAFEDAVRCVGEMEHGEYVIRVKKHEGGVVVENGPLNKTRVRDDSKTR